MTRDKFLSLGVGKEYSFTHSLSQSTIKFTILGLGLVGEDDTILFVSNSATPNADDVIERINELLAPNHHIGDLAAEFTDLSGLHYYSYKVVNH